MADRGEFQRRWEERGKGRRGKSAAAEAIDSYYNLPVIHASHWGWLVICYFFFGGISAASYVIATVAQFAGGSEMRSVARIGRYLSFAALLPCPILLVLDLGRPERFLNMMRVVKLRSPMSLGSWGLTVFGAFSTLSVITQAADDTRLGERSPGRAVSALPYKPLGIIGAFPAFFVGGYTGVLLGATAVPLWAKSAKLIGPLFLCSAFSSANSAITLTFAALKDPSTESLGRLEQLEQLTLLLELGLIVSIDRALGETAKPLHQGRTGKIAKYGVLCAGVLAPLAIATVNRRVGSQKLAILGSALAMGGGFALRYVAITAGHESADDPHATFEMTRRT